jgi:type II secretory pathway component PulK
MRIKSSNNRIKSRKGRSDKGVALIIVIFAMVLFSGLAWSLMSTQSTQTESSLRLLKSEQALYTAEAGVQWATQKVTLNPAFRTDTANGYSLGYAQHKTIDGEYRVVCRNPQ